MINVDIIQVGKGLFLTAEDLPESGLKNIIISEIERSQKNKHRSISTDSQIFGFN